MMQPKPEEAPKATPGPDLVQDQPRAPPVVGYQTGDGLGVNKYVGPDGTGKTFLGGTRDANPFGQPGFERPVV